MSTTEMAYHTFTWNGTSSDSMGIFVAEHPAITRPKERVTNVKIPGRAGDLTVTEGNDVYEPYLKNCKCVATTEADIHELCTWLKGRGEVVFGCEPEYTYDARIVNQIDFKKLYNNGVREFTIPFYCQPMKRKGSDTASVSFTASNKTITNNGDVASRPIVKITGKGNIKLTIGGTAVTLTGITDGIVINWDNGEAYSLDGSTNLNTKVSGKIQTLPVGRSTIKWSVTSSASGDGVTSVEVFKRERYL